VILRTVHLPDLYRSASAHPEIQPYYFDACLRVLREAAENCVILGDRDGIVRRDIASAVDNWPVKYRRKGQEILKRLDRLNRFVEIDDIDTESCTDEVCGRALAAARVGAPAAVLIPDRCGCRRRGCLGGSSGNIRLGEYGTSEFAEHRQSRTNIDLSYGEWRQADFDEQVWRPLFCDAKYVRIYDPIVGTKVANSLAPNFSESLEWIFINS
jgi:hypothetical protein